MDFRVDENARMILFRSRARFVVVKRDLGSIWGISLWGT
jgi:hypothetical protein